MEMRGVEPLSERMTTEASTSVVCALHSLRPLPQTGSAVTISVNFPLNYEKLGQG